MTVTDGEHVALDAVEGRRVHHHREVGPVEDAAGEHQDLTAAVLLGGRPEEADGDAELVNLCGQGQGGSEGGAGDDVVTAGVPDLGEGVVLADDADDELTLP